MRKVGLRGIERKERDQRMARRYEDGLSYAAIAKEFGLSRWHVSCCLRRQWWTASRAGDESLPLGLAELFKKRNRHLN